MLRSRLQKAYQTVLDKQSSNMQLPDAEIDSVDEQNIFQESMQMNDEVSAFLCALDGISGEEAVLNLEYNL
jgi:hypothetical protein